MNGAVKTTLSVMVKCPSCGRVMFRSESDTTIECRITGCASLGVRWKAPEVKIELVPADSPPR